MPKKKVEAEIFPPPPEHLSEASKALWQEHISEMRAPSRIALFLEALQCLDFAETARLKVASEGLTSQYGKSKMPHANPALLIRKENLNQALKIFKMLGLDTQSRYEKHDPFHFDLPDLYHEY